MISIFGLSTLLMLPNAGLALTAPPLMSLQAVSPAPYPTANLAIMLNPLLAFAEKG